MTQIQIFGTPMVLVQTQDAWYNKGIYLRQAAPWDKRRGGVSALSEAQGKVIDAFAAIQTDANAKGLNRWQRRETVKRAMSRKSFGGAPRAAKRSPAPVSTVQSAVSAAEAIVARYR